MRTLTTLALVLVTATSAAAAPWDKSGIADWATPPPPTKEPSFTPPTAHRLKLRNGLALVVVENHALPIVSMVLVAPGAGAAQDPAGKAGLASFTADLLDEGTAGMGAIAIAQEQDRLGAGIGFAVDADAAYAQVSTLTKTLDPSIALFTKLMTAPAFTDADVARVQGDRATSLELRRDRPTEVVRLVLDAALFGAASAYGHPTSGTRADFKTITAADVRGFYAAHYNPKTMTLVVAGDVDAAALKAKLDAGLGAWKPTGAVAPAKVIATPAPITSRLLLVDRPAAAQSDVRIGLVGPARKDKRFFAFEVFRTTLGDGFTSRLNQRLREQLGITYGVRAVQDWRVQPGGFVIGTAIVTPETAHGIRETLALVDDLATTDIPAAELEKSKENLIRALPAQFGTNAGTASALARLALLGLPDRYYATYAANVRKVTAKDVKAAAKALVPTGKLVVTVVGDLTKIRAELDKLGLGAPVLHDLYGVPLPIAGP
jgi:zinc protease